MPLPYVQTFRDRHGHVRYYYRRPGYRRLTLPGEPGSDEFIAAYNRAKDQKKAPSEIGASRNAPGSVASAMSLYFASAAFGQLAPDTRRTRRNELERFRQKHGDKRLAKLERRHIEQQAKTRNLLKALSPFMDWCASQDLIPANPTAGVRRPPGSREGYLTWPEEYVERYRSTHPIGSKARLAFELLVNTGAARVDVVGLGRQHARDGLLRFSRHKTKVLVQIPILDGLQAILEETDAGERLTFLLTEYGRPFTKEGFGNRFRKWCNEAGIPNGYSAHGVRKYAAVLRADLGATVNQLMAWFGWLTEREAADYTRQADRLRLAIELGRMVNAAKSTQ